MGRNSGSLVYFRSRGSSWPVPSWLLLPVDWEEDNLNHRGARLVVNSGGQGRILIAMARKYT